MIKTLFTKEVVFQQVERKASVGAQNFVEQNKEKYMSIVWLQKKTHHGSYSISPNISIKYDRVKFLSPDAVIHNFSSVWNLLDVQAAVTLSLAKQIPKFYWIQCIKDSGNSSSRFFVSEFHLFHNFVIFNDIDFKFSAVVDNNITFDLQQ